jgi:hypothetical protein
MGSFGLLIAIILLPFAFIMPGSDAAFGGAISILLFPVLYLIMGYLMTAFWLIVYNFFAPRVGGIGFELEEDPGQLTH